MGFNKAQQEAIEHVKGPMMVLAGPGSGKTTVITHRVKALIEKAGVPPENILVVTFTKASASEMKQRFLKLMGKTSVPVSFGTFHAVFFTILKHAYGYDSTSVLTEQKRREIFDMLISRYDIDVDDEGEFFDNMAGEISLVKSEMIPVDSYYSTTCAADVFRRFYKAYDAKLRSLRLIDFDDMMLYTYELFKARADILKAWQNKFRYILIDEFQDVSPLQYAIVRLLVAPENHLFIVGDDDQSIYNFRGAKPEIMLNFPKDYPEAKTVLLGINYRCTPCIVEAAGRVIGHNKVRYDKKLKAFGTEAGVPVQVKAFKTPREENEFLVQTVMKLHKDEGLSLQDIAVLFRTNHGARSLVSFLMSCNIPFKMKDTLPNIYEHWIMYDILAYMRAACGSGSRKDFLRIINRPNRYVARKYFDSEKVDLDRLKFYYDDKAWMAERIEDFEADLSVLSSLPPFAFINYLRKSVGYDDFLYTYAMDKHLNPEDFNELIDTIQEASKSFDTWEAWFSDIETYTKRLKEREKKQNISEKDALVLSTMHSAKGLEYEAVFIIDANEGVTPYQRAVLDSEIEEERRMFYVAMTRAKRFLNIYFVRERHSKKTEMSRFVSEILQ